jgi:parallel beta-helix repeat protein
LRVPKDYKTIQAAVDAAKPGDTVLVDPGIYREQVRLKDRITVKSAGDDSKGTLGLKRAEATVIGGGGVGAKGPTVVMAEGSVFDGFTVTKTGEFDQKDYDKHFAERGENLPDERGAVGAGDNFPALAIPAVTAIVRHNIVCENGHAGIGCSGAKGKRNASLVAKNVCFHNMGGGIGISDGATPTVEGNRCYNNLRGGIGNRNSRAVIIGNECFDNVRAGIGIREGATPVVRGNKCYKNRRAGIGCRMEGTSPVIEDNDCYQNGMAGIGCRDKASPIIRKNRCHENELAGIGSRDGAQPVIAENKCYRNKEAGIGIELGAKATITRNECYENARAGIGQRGDAETMIEGNHVHHNKAAGIGFEECKAGKSTVLNNKVVDNGEVAIGIHSGWKVRISGNELSRKDGLPPVVMVFKGAEADFSDNTISGSGVAGIRTEGVVRITGNKFVCPALRKGGGPPQYAVWGLAGSEIVFTGNTVDGWRHALSADKAAVTAMNNTVSGYWQAGIRLTQPVAPSIVSGNVFQSETEQPGVSVTGGEAVVESNRVDKPAPKK